MRNSISRSVRNFVERFTQRCVALLVLLLLSSCATLGSSGSPMYIGDRWAILPMTNDSGVAAASHISESMIEANLRARGVSDFTEQGGARYGISGVVTQWGRTQLNGRDARVEIALRVHDVSSGAVLWQGKRAASGRGAATLSSVANKAISGLINEWNLLHGTKRTVNDATTSQAVASSSDALSHRVSNSSIPSSLGFRTVGVDVNGFTDTVDRNLVGKSLAIFYGANPPVDELSQFDRLVLEPDNINADELQELTKHGAIAYAYLSVGEVGPTREYAASVQDDWVLGRNDVWNSKVLDLNNPDLIDFIMRRIDALVEAGYSGLFLDTMDSYQIYAKTADKRLEQEVALGSFVQEIALRHKNIRLIANRGFEVLDRTGPYLEAIAAESLFSSWDNSAQEYVDVSESDRQWLLGKLNTAKDQFDLDVVSIEYLPPERRNEARQVATSVANLGFTPWVSTPALDYVGVGAMEVMPRKIILLFDSRITDSKQLLKFIS